mmetsp:Transcript_15335/g.39088  ORF Transcript_15335/g.39088 Transcript_15335/m.39088 type:complete len:253 (+) Transcript_15335:997-1755(+)
MRSMKHDVSSWHSSSSCAGVGGGMRAAKSTPCTLAAMAASWVRRSAISCMALALRKLASQNMSLFTAAEYAPMARSATSRSLDASRFSRPTHLLCATRALLRRLRADSASAGGLSAPSSPAAPSSPPAASRSSGDPTVRAATTAMAWGSTPRWLPSASILAKRGASGNCASVRPRSVMLRASLSSSAPRCTSRCSALCRPCASGGVGKGNDVTDLMPMAFICSTMPSTGASRISGGANSSKWLANTAAENRR